MNTLLSSHKYWIRRLSLVGREKVAFLPRRLPTNYHLAPTDTRLLNVDPLAHILHFHYASIAHARADSVI